MSATDPIPPDTRSIDEMPFGSGAPDPQSVATSVRDMLKKCGVSVAHEIEALGCTGASAKGLSLTGITELRLGLAGGGVGLPCFVPPTRYCIAHGTIGGLQLGQAARFPEEVEKISRELTRKERGHIEMVEASRRVRGGDLSERLMKTADALSGRDLPPGIEHEADTGFEDGQPYRQIAEHAPQAPTAPDAFVCPEHMKPVWSCRYCVAQMVVEGPLEPEFMVESEKGEDLESEAIDAADIESYVQDASTEGCDEVTVYVRAAYYKRKLARD